MNGHVTQWFASEPRSVLRDLGGVHHEINTLFEGAFGNRAVEAAADWAPRVETFLKDDALHVRADLPGVDPKAVDISVDDDVLVVSGERKTEHEEPAYREVTYGRFERRIRVPDGVNPESITARYTNGVLEITVPISKPVSRKVTVQVTDKAQGTA